MCACACVRLCVRVRVCVCMCVCEQELLTKVDAARPDFAPNLSASTLATSTQVGSPTSPTVARRQAQPALICAGTGLTRCMTRFASARVLAYGPARPRPRR
jgi:hypothetical protein